MLGKDAGYLFRMSNTVVPKKQKAFFLSEISYNWVFCDDEVWIVFMCDLVNGEGVAVRTGAARQEDVQSVIFYIRFNFVLWIKKRKSCWGVEVQPQTRLTRGGAPAATGWWVTPASEGEVVSVKASSSAANVTRVEATCNQTPAAAFKRCMSGQNVNNKKKGETGRSLVPNTNQNPPHISCNFT